MDRVKRVPEKREDFIRPLADDLNVTIEEALLIYRDFLKSIVERARQNNGKFAVRGFGKYAIHRTKTRKKGNLPKSYLKIKILLEGLGEAN